MTTTTNSRLSKLGGGTYAQNQRLFLFPMIKMAIGTCLNWKLIFIFILKMQNYSKVYWDHVVHAFRTERTMDCLIMLNMEQSGLIIMIKVVNTMPGLNIPGYCAEFCLMMLEEEQYTGKDISDRIPFVESCVQFFYEHIIRKKKENGKTI
jgi:hypothetical protein